MCESVLTTRVLTDTLQHEIACLEPRGVKFCGILSIGPN